MVTLLVLEDDDGIRAAMALAMEDEGYDVVEAASAEAALVLVGRTPPDLMLVDLMLGGMDGLSFIRQVRPFSQAPIIVVSARRDTDDIVAALEAGADDYVTKPFQVVEVTARLRAMRRRHAAPVGGPDAGPRGDGVVLSPDGPLVLDVAAGVVRRGGEELSLTVTEFRLLTELATHPGHVLSRRALLERVWDRDYFGDERIVDVHVRRLRTKVERDPSAPAVVLTVRGQGYRVDVP
ncbi:response regulator transcription factor [Lapillicoccus jejuensis]|uniref:DNA-binding response OmpR family regulator n=1 Tax=Lapillicoccus jejuensis TaxID=402171 RepID=A0A542DWU4_9MICO|nr:response regulator transcription factor [Lapillicoccus jejuensis]TQJ07557.1 DNA-binding response OmpR family regulator [Lapillicoccus jejuensis]